MACSILKPSGQCVLMMMKRSHDAEHACSPVYWVEGYNAMGDTDKSHHLLRHPAWIMGGVVVLALTAGPIVDVDHPIAWMVGIADGRFLMPYFDVASYILVGSGLVMAVACLCRYACLRLLRRFG